MKKFFVGTPLEDSKETTLTGRGLMPWQQKVADERTGKRRFHGAFTGGFAAGYHNTCGSELGWTPTQFVSSRQKRASLHQEVGDYMDDEDLGELDMASTLKTTTDYLAQPKDNVGVRLFKLSRAQTVDDPEPLEPKTNSTGLGFTGAIQPASTVIDDVEYSFYEPSDAQDSLVFVEGARIKPQAPLQLPELPTNYTPRKYLMNHRAALTSKKLTSVPERTAVMAEPLFSSILSPADIERIGKIKTFVQSRDLRQKYTEMRALPFSDNPNKQERFFRYVSSQEGRLVAGVGPVNLMTASQIREENAEFKALYEATDKSEEVPRSAPVAERSSEQWKPAKIICIRFGIPEPEASLPRTKQENSNDLGLTIQSSRRTEDLLEPAKHMALFKSIFDDETLPTKRSRGV